MKIIGAGFGRTGTTSLRAALVQLGFGPCYHMLEIALKLRHARTWLAAAQGQPVDWQHFLRNYQATLDYPASAFYRELMEAFPDAKVLLSVRDPDRWYKSTLNTIYAQPAFTPLLRRLFPPLRTMTLMVHATIWDRIFHGRFEDRDYAISIFNQHIENVKASVPPDKLLIFDVKEGWGPLCDFLDVPVPAEPFPHLNDRVTFERIKRGLTFARRWGPLIGLGLLVLIAWLILR